MPWFKGPRASATQLPECWLALVCCWFRLPFGGSVPGDAKFLGACGAWLGPVDVVFAGLVGLAAGAFLALFMVMFEPATRRKQMFWHLRLAVTTLSPPAAPASRALVVPLAIPLAASAVMVLAVGGM